MKASKYNRIALGLLLAGLTTWLTPSTPAVTRTWDGGPTSTDTELGTAANWSGDTLPSASAGDFAEWNGTAAGNLVLSHGTANFAGSAGNPGINLSLTAGQTGSLAIDSGANTSAIRMNALSIASGAGAFTLGNGAGTFNLTLGGAGGQTHNWTNDSANVATIQSDIVWGLGGGGTHTLALSGTGSWTFNNVMGQGSGTLNVNKAGAGTVTFTGPNTYTGTTTVGAGTLTLSGSGTIGATTSALTINGGTLDLAGFTRTNGTVTLTSGTITNGTLTASTLTANGSVAMSVPARLAGAAALTKTGAGTLTLNGTVPNIYTGGTTIGTGGGAGVLRLAATHALGTGNVTLDTTGNASTARLEFDGGITLTNNVNFPGRNNSSVGLQNITGNNLVAGTITLNSGGSVYQIQSDANTLTLGTVAATAISAASGGRNLTLQGAGNGAIVGDIVNGGGLVGIIKTGAGTWTLSGATTYGGSTTVSNGTLAYAGSAAPANSTNITVLSGGTLDVSASSLNLGSFQTLGGNGTVNGSVADSAGTLILPGGASAAGQLTINNNLTLSGGGTLRFDFVTGTNDSIVVGGNLAASGTTSINLASLPGGGLPNGTYTLLRVTGTLGGSSANFTVTGVPAGRQVFSITYDSVSSPKRVLLQVTGSPAPLVWRGIGTDWDIQTSLHWTNTAAGSNDFFYDGDNVSFTDLGLANSPVLGTNVQPASTTFNAAGSYTLSGTGKITGAGSLTKSGSGTVTIQNTNDYTGVTALNGGTVSVDYVTNGGVASALGAAPSASANLNFNGGTLEITGAGSSSDRGATLNAGGGTVAVANAASTVTVSGAIAGTGGLTKTGNGILALGGANTYGGATLVSAGTLTANGGNAIGDASAVTLDDVAGVTLNLGASETIGSLAGGGFNGGNVLLNANRLTLGGNHSSTTYSGSISGTGGITKTGTGTLTLNNSHSFSGSLFGKAGTIVLDGGASIPSMTAYNSIGQDGTDNATLTLQGSGLLATTSDFNVGDIGASAGTLNVADSASLSANALFIASANASGSTASGTVNQTGGNVTQTSTGIGTFVIGGRTDTAGFASGVGVYNISGGSLTAAAGIRVGGVGTGTLNISGTANVTANGGINIARISGSRGTANLDGGTFTTFNIASSTGVNATNNFNGSTVRPTANNTTFCQGLTRANVRDGGAIFDTTGFNVTIAQALLHSDRAGDNATDGGLTKNGSGVLTLTGTNTYTGPTVVNGDALVVNGVLGAGSVTVNFGSALSGNGLIQGPVTIDGGAISPGANVGVLTISNNLTLSATFSSAASFTFVTGSNSTLTVSGALNVPNATGINLNFVSAVPPVGTNTLIRYGSLSGASFANLSILTTNPRYSFNLYNDTVAKEIKLVIAGVPAALTWVGDGVLNYWDNTTGFTNWLNGVTLDYFFDGDSVTFNNTGANTPAVSVQNTVFPGSVTVDATQDYEFAGPGAVASPGSLTKNGAATLLLTTSNSFAGAAIINAGTVQVGNAGTTGMLVAGSITNNSALTFNRSDVVTLSSPVAGTGSLTQNGTSDLLLNASNIFSGPVVVNAGFVKPRNTYAFGSAASGTYATNGGQVYFDLNLDSPEEPFILGGAALRKGGGGVSTLGGQLTLVADTTIQVDGGATLNLTNSAGITGSAANLTLQGDGGSAGNIAGPTTLGTGGLTKGGAGTWTLGQNNSYTGLTTINAGTLRISDGNVGNPAGFTANQVTLAGGTLTAATNVSFVGGSIGFAVTGTTGGFGVEAGATLTISNDISGTGALTKFGPGTLALVGPNTFSGTLNLDSFINSGSDGAVLVTTSNALASVASPIYSRNNNGGSSTLQLSGVGVAQNFVASCRNSGVAWVQNVAGNSTLHGVIQVEVGGGTLPFESAAGLLTIANNIQYIGTSVNGRTYQFGGAGNTLVSGTILNGDNGAPVSVSKAGTGTLTLAAANTYLGATVINNGLLSLTGSISSTGAVNVAGGTLGGTGTINDNVTVGAAGTLAPGTSIGSLTINGNLTLNGTTSIEINKTAGTRDQVVGLNTVNYGGTLVVTNLSGTLGVGDAFTLFSAATHNGGFASIVGSPGPGLAYSFTNGVLSVVTGIASNPTNITFSVSGGNLNLSWPGSHKGWILQSQTNTLGVGISTNWADVPGSESVTNTSITINPTNPTVFFRLRLP